MRLNSTEDLSKHVGHNVRVQGNENTSSAKDNAAGSSASNSATSTKPSKSASDMEATGGGKEIQVTRLT